MPVVFGDVLGGAVLELEQLPVPAGGDSSEHLMMILPGTDEVSGQLTGTA